MISGAGIKEGRDGYRRGVVFGLTMAEVFLLLLFCLMMAVAAVHQRSDPERLREELERTKAELSTLKKEAGKFSELAKSPASPNTLEAVVRLLTRLDRDQLTRLADTKAEDVVSATELAELNPTPEDWRELKEFQKLLNNKSPKPRLTDLFDALEKQDSIKKLEAVVRLLTRLDRDQLTRLADTKAEDVVSATELAKLNPTPEDWRELKEFQKLLNNKSPKPRLTDLFDALEKQDSIKKLGIENPSDPKTISAIKNALDRLENGSEGINEWPPIISLSEANNNFFERGSAVLESGFISSLKQEVTVKLAKTLDEYSAGQLILPDETTTDGANARDEKTRRRIEIRVRRKESKQ